MSTTEKYYYTKNIDAEVLMEAIQLRTSLRSVFVGCHVTVNGDGTVDDDNIEIEFTRALTSPEQDEITNVVNAIGPTYDLMVRKGIQRNTMTWARRKGVELMDIFTSSNVYAQKSATQIRALVADYPVLMNSLMTGSLTTAYGEFLVMQPDANISQAEIDEFKLRLEIILGL